MHYNRQQIRSQQVSFNSSVNLYLTDQGNLTVQGRNFDTSHSGKKLCHGSFSRRKLIQNSQQIVTDFSENCHRPLINCHRPLINCHRPLINYHRPLINCHRPLGNFASLSYFAHRTIYRIIDLLICSYYYRSCECEIGFMHRSILQWGTKFYNYSGCPVHPMLNELIYHKLHGSVIIWW